jgi:microcystin-dependent protein
MVNSFSDGKGQLVEPPYGSYVDSWQLPVNSNFGLTDALVSGTTTINVATIPIATPFVTLVFQNFDTSPTPWQVPLAGQNLRIVLTGSVAFNVTIFIPANYPGMWIIDNKTNGAFPITVKTNASGSVGINPPQGYMSYVFCDGTNVYWADQGNVIANVPSGIPYGAIMPFAMSAVPFGWLVCNGAGVSRTTYANLFAAIGTVWGTGDGSTTFNVPNFLGSFLRGWNGTASGLDANRAFGSFQANAYTNHTHTATSIDAGHIHQIINTGPNANGGGDGWLVNPNPARLTPTQTGFAQITTTVNESTTGSTETRPDNFAVQYCIKA